MCFFFFVLFLDLLNTCKKNDCLVQWNTLGVSVVKMMWFCFVCFFLLPARILRLTLAWCYWTPKAKTLHVAIVDLVWGHGKAPIAGFVIYFWSISLEITETNSAVGLQLASTRLILITMTSIGFKDRVPYWTREGKRVFIGFPGFCSELISVTDSHSIPPSVFCLCQSVLCVVCWWHSGSFPVFQASVHSHLRSIS